MGSNSFDDIIKSKLRELENQPIPSDWDAFEQKYDKALSGDEPTIDGPIALGSDSFDNIIKNKLKELENEPAASDWDAFEQLFNDELSGTDLTFDRAIADKVDHFNVAFNSQHWVMMKEKLEREEFLRTSIYFSKIAEAAIVFLLLFTFLNLFPALQYEKPSGAYANVTSSSLQDDSVNNTSATTNNNYSTENSTISGEAADQTRLERLSNAISGEKRTYLSVEPIRNPGFAALIPQGIQDPKLVSQTPVAKEMKALAATDNLNAAIENEKMEIYRAKVLATDLNKPKGESLVSLSFSPTVNIVNSPANYILNTQPYTVDALGIEAGLGYSFRKNGFEVGTGISYARKAYNPQIQNQITGRFSEGYAVETLKNIEFDLISVPLFLNYSLVSGDDFNFYAGIGSSVNMITSAGYRVRENGEEFDVLSRFQETGRSSSREYTQGLFQGGSLHDNIFISLDISIGLETKLTDHLSIFFAPTLRQHIGIAGIGPNKDHVHSLGLNMGLKKKI